MKTIEELWPDPEHQAKVRAIWEASHRASNRIHREAALDGEISGTRMVEIMREEMPGLPERVYLDIVAEYAKEISK